MEFLAMSETHYVSTVEKRNCQVPNDKTCDQSIVEKRINDKHEKRRADQGYMKEYIKKELMQILEKERIKILCKGTTILKQLGRKRTNPEHVRENHKRSKRKWKAENPDHIKEIAKKSSGR